MKNNKFLIYLSRTVPYYIWICLVFATVTLIYDAYIAIVEYIAVAVLTAIYWSDAVKRHNLLSDYVHSFVYKGETTSGEPLDKFPMPVVIVAPDGKILWHNSAFSGLLGQDNIFDINLGDYIPEFNTDILETDGDNVSAVVEYKDRNYHVFGNIALISDNGKDIGEYIVLYWDDVTAYTELETKYRDEAFVSCVAVIDNYEEVMQDTLNPDKPKLAASIEEKLQLFAQSANGILRKYEKDRFFFYFQKQYLDDFMENKFDILDDIKSISVGNKIPPTVSMGIGIGGKTMAANDSYSFSALDMALGRGGDQVIIKENDQYHFFGGKSGGVEKRSRVKSRLVAFALRELVSNSDKIFIMGHKRADVDVLGSALGLYAGIRALGKSAYIVLDRGNHTVDKFMTGIESEYKNVFINKFGAVELADENSLIIVVDTHKTSLVEQPVLLDISKNVVVIDHHRRSTDYVQNPILTYHEPYASSASELVTEVVQYMDAKAELTKNEAEALYAGIFLDTKGFTFKTGVRTFEAAAYLRRNDVDTIKIKKLFQIDLDTFMNKWNIIENVRELRPSMAVATCVQNDDDDMQLIVAQATDELLNITNITSSFVLCDMGDSTIISARSLGETNVQIIMEKLGGGGHMTIAGAQLKDVTLDNALSMLTTAVDEYINNK